VIKRGGSPVVLLTATPIQNSLAELWGLVQYVEPTGTLLGRLPTFREIFCDAGDRTVLPDQAPELRRRLQMVLQRTLRRQAQEFLQVPFVERHSRVFEYAMSPDEQALYTDVTAWLMRENPHAFRGNQRHLLLITFHRRMASSLAALSVRNTTFAGTASVPAHRARGSLAALPRRCQPIGAPERSAVRSERLPVANSFNSIGTHRSPSSIRISASALPSASCTG
jgi:hypothetical protein